MARPWLAWVLLLGALAQILLVAVVPYPPIQDYPNHLLRVHAAESLDRVPVYSEYLTRDSAFRPNSLGDWVVGALYGPLPIELAGKIWLALCLALASAALWYYLVTFGGDILGAFIGLLVIGGWLFHKGFLNNHAAVSLGLIYLAVLWPRDNKLTWRRWFVAWGVSLAIVSAHAFVYASVMAIAGAAALLQPGESWRRRLWRVSPAIPGVLLGLIYALQQSGSGLLANRPRYDFNLKRWFVWTPLSIFGRFQPAWDQWIALGCLALIAVAFCFGVYRLRARLLPSHWQVVLLFVIACLGLYLVAPTHLSGGWVHGRERVFHMAILLALPLLAALPSVFRRVAGTAAGVGLIVTMALTARAYQDFQPAAQEYVGLAEALPRGQLILTLNLASPLNELIRPRLHLWGYLCIRKDCLSPFLFANPYTNNLYFRRMPEWPPEGELEPRDWGSIVDLLNRESYTGVLLHGRSAEGESRLEDVMEAAASNRSGVLYLVAGARDPDSR